MFTNFENMPQQTDKAIRFFFVTQGITLRNRNKLKHYLRGMVKKEGKKLDYLNYIFCSDEYLLEINRRYLQHDYYTDIITFDLSEHSSSIQAEIYISVDRIRIIPGDLASLQTQRFTESYFTDYFTCVGMGIRVARRKQK